MYKLIKWHDVEDKVLNDPTKYTVLKENVTTPSTVGLDPDLEYFIIDIPFVEPEYDPRLVTITEAHEMLDELDNGFRKWQITYAITERSAEEKKISVEEAEVEQNFKIITTSKQLKYLALYAVITNRRVQGLTITQAMLDLEAIVEAKALKIWQNHITSLAKQAAIDLGDPFDIDSDWENDLS